MAQNEMVVAGASGVVGRHLIAAALERDWRVRVLSRHPLRRSPFDPDRVEYRPWDPRGSTDLGSEEIAALADVLEGCDLLVNLAGSSVADGRLNDAHRDRVLDSRVNATALLCEAWHAATEPPRAWIQASAVGFYGDRGEEQVTEESSAGDAFLSDVCVRWEEMASSSLDGKECRLIVARLGLVLAEDAEAWDRFLQPLRFGLGGRLGSGRQWWAWIDADDVAGAFLHLFEGPRASGVYNLCSPEPVRQIELARGAGKRLRRPIWLPAPARLLRLVIGDVADELLLPSCRALPTRLLDSGYEFLSPTPETMLDKLLA